MSHTHTHTHTHTQLLVSDNTHDNAVTVWCLLSVCPQLIINDPAECRPLTLPVMRGGCGEVSGAGSAGCNWCVGGLLQLLTSLSGL